MKKKQDLRASIKIEAVLHRQIKIYCAENEVKMETAVNTWLEAALKKKLKK